ncbi:MAG: hypothetical protein JOZ99_05555, partial [Actinobacteria bacterium]|nr:hypothetical protein [Actinomycetota bacterium]
EVEAVAAAWPNTEVEIVGGASHFFVGRTDRLVEKVLRFFDRLTDERAARPSPPG